MERNSKISNGKKSMVNNTPKQSLIHTRSELENVVGAILYHGYTLSTLFIHTHTENYRTHFDKFTTMIRNKESCAVICSHMNLPYNEIDSIKISSLDENKSILGTIFMNTTLHPDATPRAQTKKRILLPNTIDIRYTNGLIISMNRIITKNVKNPDDLTHLLQQQEKIFGLEYYGYSYMILIKKINTFPNFTTSLPSLNITKDYISFRIRSHDQFMLNHYKIESIVRERIDGWAMLENMKMDDVLYGDLAPLEAYLDIFHI